MECFFPSYTQDGVQRSTATTEYTYDNNGNLKSDLNKGISNITYNCLNFDKIGCASEMLK